MAESVLELGNGLEIWRVGLDELREQDLNGRSMPKAMFDRLQQTISRDGRLESLPLCARMDRGDEEVYEIVSGHHRVRAARAAEMSETYVIMDISGLTPSQIKAKQLAHNSISGVDNSELVKRIYESIEDVDAKVDAFINPVELDLKIDPVPVAAMDVGLDYRTIQIIFLPYEKERFARAVDAIGEELSTQVDSLYLTDIETFDLFKKLLERIGKEYEVRSMGALMSQMSTICLEYLGEEIDPEELEAEGALPTRDVLGGVMVPFPECLVIQKAVDEAKDASEELSKMQALGLICQNYLDSK